MKEWLLKKKWRAILAGILVVAIPLISLALFVNFSATAALEERVINENRNYSLLAAHTLEMNVKNIVYAGKAFATRHLLLQDLKKHAYKETQIQLKGLLDNIPGIQRAFITTPQGIQISNYPFTADTIGKDFSSRDWYTGVSRKWEPYVSEFYVRTAKPQKYLFAIAIPIREEGHVKGILVMQPGDDFIKKSMVDIDIGTGYIYVVDKKGALIYHQELSIDRVIDFSNVPVVRKVLNRMDGVERIIDPVLKVPAISSYHPIEEWGWGVIVDRQVAEVLAPVKKVTFWLFVVTGFILLGSGFIAYRGADLLVETELLTKKLRAMNGELESRQSELKEANIKLEEVSMAKSDFLANMSHELRTPLNSILGFSEVLQDEMFGKLNEKQHEYVKNIYSSGKHLLSLINDILDLSKVESGKMELELNRFLLKGLLSSSMNMLKEKAIKHSISLTLDIQPEADIGIEADERKIKQIMFNLLSNAVKFTEDGGSVSVSARKMQKRGGSEAQEQKTPPQPPLAKGGIEGGVVYDLNADFIEISVIDTGIGIKPEDLPKLFKEFTQLESAYTKNYEGTGLGLALTRRLVELHGGKIWVKSESGNGSRFTFVIPVRQTKA